MKAESPEMIAFDRETFAKTAFQVVHGIYDATSTIIHGEENIAVITGKKSE